MLLVVRFLLKPDRQVGGDRDVSGCRCVSFYFRYRSYLMLYIVEQVVTVAYVCAVV